MNRGLRSGFLLMCIVASVVCVLLMLKAHEAKRRNDAIVWIEEQVGAIFDPTGPNTWAIISFRGAAIDDKSLPSVAEHLKPLGAIWELDMRDTRITGRTLAALSSLEHVDRIVLDPTQVNRDSIQQLNRCTSIDGIKLIGDATEAAVIELLPALREWSRPGKKILVLDSLSADGFRRLVEDAPNLSGLQTEADNYWHPIAMRAGPR